VKSLLCCMLLLTTSHVVSAQDAVVRLTRKVDAVEVSIGGRPFAVYNIGKDLPKPFFSPVLTPGGKIMSRPIEKPGDDHPHHKGIWVAVDEVNDVRFWAERGKIQNVAVKLLKSSSGPPSANVPRTSVDFSAGSPAQLLVVNHWLGDDGKPVVTETTVIGIYSNRLLTYDITFTAGGRQVTFGDTKEGMFGVRMVDSMREQEGGQVVNADDLQGCSQCWGKVSDWVDYFGKVDGETVGVALFDHPLNFRRSRYHVRSYGLFTLSPFGERAYTGGKRPADPLILLPDSSLRLRYGIFFHAGDTNAGQVADMYLRYLKLAS